MFRQMLRTKIHRATVTEADLNYVGSITLDEDLMEMAGLLEYEWVTVVNINNGARFETYVITGKRGTGQICLNGAAARLVQPGDKIIVMALGNYADDELKTHKPTIILVEDNENKVCRFL